jgi:adenosine deaminase
MDISTDLRCWLGLTILILVMWAIRRKQQRQLHAAYLAGFVSLPKVEVHAHVGGSARRDTVEELLRAHGHLNPRGRAAAMVIGREPDGVPLEPTPYFGFAIVNEAVREPAHVARIVAEYLHDCALDGIHYAELRTGGTNRAHLEAVLEAMQQQRQVAAALIISVKRDAPADAAWSTVRNAVELRDCGFPIVAVDFCGVIPAAREQFRPFGGEWARAVQWAQAQGLPFVPHFAETQGETDLEAILDSKPVRLGHCLHPTAASWRRISAQRIPIECCLASNLNVLRRDGWLPLTKLYAPSAAANHPLVHGWPALDIPGYWMSHPVVLCCDNVGLLEYPLSEIYRTAAEAIAGNGNREKAKAIAWKLAADAVSHTFADEQIKRQLRSKLMAHPWCPHH